ncbi:ABC transporter ATP-binding protein [Terrarubrum flagellatum]|uniref:ABC transporter ATP-binding protein n=1 Tax=Terrirubrum flagellatum TaxID=2895980 RepID=UPI00314567E8
MTPPASAGAPLLEVANLSVRFGGLVAVNDLNFTVARGEIVALLGPNGAGKTTTFHLIAGAQQPTSGRIVFEGIDLSGMRPDARCRLGLARTFQITQPFHELSVVENVMVGAMQHHRVLDAARYDARRYVDMVGLAEKADQLAKGLSTGQRKRLEMARAAATRPKLLLMDEVTGGVDQKSIPGMIALVKQLRDEGLTIILIEHNMRVISEVADRAIFMNRGVKIAEGTPAEIARHPDVIDLYLGEAAHA